MKRRIPPFAICLILIGIVLIILSITLITKGVLIELFKNNVYKELPLVEGTRNYYFWSAPTKVDFKVYIFHVTNPEDVMQGEAPLFEERGPYCYKEIMVKEPMDVDETTDELRYMKRQTYFFDKHATGNLSMNEKLTILNPAYMGSVITLSGFPENFMRQYGSSIPKLFRNPNSIFIEGKPNDILFNGLKLTCNAKKFPDLFNVCQLLKTKPPPMLKSTGNEGFYVFSFLDQLNDTLQGPFGINRGLKNISSLSEFMSLKNKEMQKVWNSEECNTVRGRDIAFWPPMKNGYEPNAVTFEPAMCRRIPVHYAEEIYIDGVAGGKYVFRNEKLPENETDCYCPIVKKQKECLPMGLFDGTVCQETPVVFSEPHFYHGDPQLLQYARGLKPVKKKHEMFIVIEKLTGAMLAGSKLSQFNMKLSKHPTDLLSNVSEGYFPLIWFVEELAQDWSRTAFLYQIIRLKNLMIYFQIIPLIIGIHLIFSMLYLYLPKRQEQDFPIQESILLSPSSRPNDFNYGPQHRLRWAFQ